MKSLKVLAAVAVVCSVAGAAMADQCKPIHARFGLATFLGPCSYEETAYADCIDRPVRGTVNGIWHTFAPDDNWVCLAPIPGFGCLDPPPAPYSPLAAGYAFSVLETAKGIVYLQDSWVWNLSFMLNPAHLEGTKAVFPAVSISVIAGGTGHYEEAWGWIGFIADDGPWMGFIAGEICTPGAED